MQPSPSTAEASDSGLKRASRAPRRRQVLRVAAGAAILFALAWFVLPVLGGSYTEGFESTIAINARKLATGQLGEVDLLYPFSGRFFLITRLGSEIVLGALGTVTGLPSLVNLRLIMLASLLVLVGSIVHILRRRYGVPPLLGCLACLLFPPIFESAYFFNDNVLSAALSTLALAVFWTGLSLPATAAAALLLGLATATRIDAAFIAPAFAVLLWFELPDWRTRLRHALVAAPIVALVPLAVYAAYGISYFEIFEVVPRAVALWNRPFGPGIWVAHALNGVSLPAMLALPLGIGSFLLRRRWREVWLCVAVPLLYLAAYGRSLFELRYLLPLAPFVAIAIVEGGRVALRSTGRQRTVLLASFAIAFAACFAPPVPITHWRLSSDGDGPRPIVGRFWSPAAWSWWTGTLNGAITVLDGEVEQAGRAGGASVIVTSSWNSDRLVHLTLMERGFKERGDRVPAACRTVAELFTRGEATVLHVRVHIPFVAKQREVVLWQETALPCLRDAGLDGDPVLFVDWVNVAPRGLQVAGKAAPPANLYQPTFQAIGRWADPVVWKLWSYSVTRVPVADIAPRLGQPMTPEELRIARNLAETRGGLLP